MNLFQINIFVQDFDRMLRFYRDQLGFDVNDIDPGSPYKPLVNWASLKTGSLTLELFDVATLGRGSANGATPGDAIQLAFVVDDVAASRERLEAAGVSCDPVIEEDWGWFARFRDPEGNRLQIYEAFGPGGGSGS